MVQQIQPHYVVPEVEIVAVEALEQVEQSSALSSELMADPRLRKVTFTGSTGVGASERAMVCAQLIFICCSNQPKECAPGPTRCSSTQT